ncbi:hypothetical protein JCM11251_001907 [Rhodosporidiobolus azoricus]
MTTHSHPLTAHPAHSDLAAPRQQHPLQAELAANSPPASDFLPPASPAPAPAPSASSLSLDKPSPLFDPAAMSSTYSSPQEALAPTASAGSADRVEAKPRRSGPVIWGFDLSELSFGAFSTKSLMDPKWHLRKERIIFYQLAMMVCLAAECCATYSLSKYEDQQDNIERDFPPAHVYNNDLIDMEITTIVMCVMVATLFGADFFFLAQFPKRTYPMWYQKTKKALAVTVTSGVLAAAIGLTVVVARNSARIVHVPQEVVDAATDLYFRPPLQYNKWAVNIAAVCVLWPGWVFCVISTIFMFMAADYDALHGVAPRGVPKTSSGSISNVPLSTPPALHTTSDPHASATTQSTLPGGAHREGEKIVLPAPEGRYLAVEQPRGDGRLSVEMDHGTFEGEGRHPGSVIAGARRSAAENMV